MTGKAASASQTGAETRIAVPRYGVLRKMYLRVELKYADAAGTNDVTMGDWGPVGAFTRFDLKARDKTIATLYPENIVDWIKSQGYNVSKFWKEHLAANNGILLTNGDGSSSTDYVNIPLPFSFTERVANALNTRFAEPLELVVTETAAITDWSVATTVDTWEMGWNAVFYYLSPGQEELANMKQTMLKAGRAGVPRLQYSVYKESDYTTGTSTASMTLKCPYPVFRTVLYFDAGTSAKPLNTATSGNLTALDFKSSGTSIISVTDSGTLRALMAEPEFGYDARPLASGLSGDDDSRNEVYVINWGLMSDSTDQTGILSMKNLANPELEITTTASTTLKVFHYYYQIESTSPDDGQISVRALT